MPVRIDEDWKARLRAELPERPFERQQRLMSAPYYLQYSSANILMTDQDRYMAFETERIELEKAERDSVKLREGYRIIANLIINELPRVRTQYGVQKYYPSYSDPTIPQYINRYLDVSGFEFTNTGPGIPTFKSPPPQDFVLPESSQNNSAPIPAHAFPTGMAPGAIAGLAPLITSNVLSLSGAKVVFDLMYQIGGEPLKIVNFTGMAQSTDTGQLEGWCDAAIAADPRSVEQVKTGNPKAINALKGAVMKLSAGKANPKLVDEILKKRLGV